MTLEGQLWGGVSVPDVAVSHGSNPELGFVVFLLGTCYLLQGKNWPTGNKVSCLFLRQELL